MFKRDGSVFNEAINDVIDRWTKNSSKTPDNVMINVDSSVHYAPDNSVHYAPVDDHSVSYAPPNAETKSTDQMMPTSQAVADDQADNKAEQQGSKEQAAGAEL